MVTAPLTWSYYSKILPHVRKATTMLDMETGGGEFLSNLQPLPPYIFATEGYKPNIPVARKKLEPIGVNVVINYEGDPLPFDENYFDLIINRHGFFDSIEVERTLKVGGRFITQQVGADDDCIGLNEMLGAAIPKGSADWDSKVAVELLQQAGLEVIEINEFKPITRFFDVVAITYYLKIIEWQVPEFSVKKYFNQLSKMNDKIEKHGYIDFISHRFFMHFLKV